DCRGPQDAFPSRREDHSAALRSRGWQRAYARRGGPELRRDPRAYSPDRSQGFAQTASSQPQLQAENLPRRTVDRVTDFIQVIARCITSRDREGAVYHGVKPTSTPIPSRSRLVNAAGQSNTRARLISTPPVIGSLLLVQQFLHRGRRLEP